MGNAQSDFQKLGDALDPNKNGVANAFDPNKNGVANAFDPNKNGVANFFNNDVKNGIIDLGKGAGNLASTAVNTALTPVRLVGSVAGVNIPNIPMAGGGGPISNLTQTVGNITNSLNPMNIAGGAIPGLLNQVPGALASGASSVASNPMGLVGGLLGGIAPGLGGGGALQGGQATGEKIAVGNTIIQTQTNTQTGLPLATSGANTTAFGSGQTGQGSVGSGNSVNTGLANGANAGTLTGTAPLGAGTDPAKTQALIEAQQGAQFLQVAVMAGGALAMILLLKKKPNK